MSDAVARSYAVGGTLPVMLGRPRPRTCMARVHGLMKDYCETALETEISGIEARHWISFVKTYTDATDRTDIDAKVQRIMARNKRADGRTAELANAVTTLMDIVFAPEA